MADADTWRYRGALLASFVSMFAWIGFVLAWIVLVYVILAGGPLELVFWATIVTVVVAMGAAKLESYLFDADELG